MTFQPCSMPEEDWATTFPSDNSNSWIHVQDCDWQNQKSPMVNQDPYSLDSSWLTTTQGSVVAGLSPSLSHESQTSRTLSSHANMDVPHLPQSLDLSFVGNEEASWDPTYPVTSQVLSTAHPDMFTKVVGSTAFSGDQGLPAHLAYHAIPGPSVTASSPQLSMHSSQGPLDPSRRRTVSDASTVQQRPLLPRTIPQQAIPESHASSRQCRVLKPRQISVGYTDTVHSVSDASGMVQVSAGVRHGYALPTSRPQVIVQAIGSNAISSHVTSPLEATYQRRPTVPLSIAQDSATLDYDSFIKYDQDDHVSVQTSRLDSSTKSVASHQTNRYRSYLQTHPAVPMAMAARQSANTVVVKSEVPTWAPPSILASNPTVITPNDENEGRSRSHPLYSQPAAADGLYHCPFAPDGSCQHKPVKLKCSYDKYLDSHLKPFTCNKEICGKLQFSSTACLLRHEREAHGMHGHGNRPNLCLYEGCERSQPDQGFPRKYNLNDHMKRVHGHQEPIQDRTSYPNGAIRNSRKGGGRKRKHQGEELDEPGPQRRRQLSPSYHDQPLPVGQWST